MFNVADVLEARPLVFKRGRVLVLQTVSITRVVYSFTDLYVDSLEISGVALGGPWTYVEKVRATKKGYFPVQRHVLRNSGIVRKEVQQKPSNDANIRSSTQDLTQVASAGAGTYGDLIRAMFVSPYSRPKVSLRRTARMEYGFAGSPNDSACYCMIARAIFLE